MKSNTFEVMRYDADEGMVFDWVEPHFQEDENGDQIQVHLNTKTIFIGANDNINNYIEVEKVEDE